MAQGAVTLDKYDPLDTGFRSRIAASILRLLGTPRFLDTNPTTPSNRYLCSLRRNCRSLISSLAAAIPFGRKKVGDVMSDVYLCCRDKTPLVSTARAMADTGWRSVLVVNAQGKPLGLFSGLDLLSLSAEGRADHTTVSEVMHPLLTIPISASLRDAADMMIENHHHRLVVVDPKSPDSMPLGIISSFDIVAEMAHPESVWQK